MSNFDMRMMDLKRVEVNELKRGMELLGLQREPTGSAGEFRLKLIKYKLQGDEKE